MRRDEAIGFYDLGATPFFACQDDPRFSYCLFVPEDYRDRTDTVYRIIVAVHGTNRPAAGYRDAFADLARSHEAIVLAPLFPAGVREPGELHDYKFIEGDGVRYDRLLLSMVDEVVARYRADGNRLYLHGFSGGAHFAHRFLYLHPDRLAAVSIAAPGMVTLLDRNRRWWAGVADLEERFGIDLDLDAIRAVDVQLVIGDRDVETWEITLQPGDHRWVEGANDSGATRLERLAALRSSLEDHGVRVQHDIVPGVAHEGWALIPAATAFFADSLTTHGGSPPTHETCSSYVEGRDPHESVQP